MVFLKVAYKYKFWFNAIEPQGIVPHSSNLVRLSQLSNHAGVISEPKLHESIIVYN